MRHRRRKAPRRPSTARAAGVPRSRAAERHRERVHQETDHQDTADQHQPDAVGQRRRNREPPDVVRARLQQHPELVEGLGPRDDPEEGLLPGEDQRQQHQRHQRLHRHGQRPGQRNPSGQRARTGLHRQQKRRLEEPGRRIDQRQQSSRGHESGRRREQRQSRPPAHEPPPPAVLPVDATPVRCRSASRHRSAIPAPVAPSQPSSPPRAACAVDPRSCPTARERPPVPASMPRCPAGRRRPCRCAGASWRAPSPVPRPDHRGRRSAALRSRRAARRKHGTDLCRPSGR